MRKEKLLILFLLRFLFIYFLPLKPQSKHLEVCAGDDMSKCNYLHCAVYKLF